MLTKTLLALAAASVIKDVVALGPRQHHHQRLHEKRAIVTEVVTVTDVVYVTLYEDQATSSSAVSAKQFYTKKGRKSRSSSAVASATPSPVLSLEALPRPSAPVEVPAPPAPVPTVEAPVAEPAPVSPPAVDPVPAEPAEPATPVTPPSGGAPAGKRGRGLAFNDPNLLGRFLGSGSHISWTYNWAQTDDSKTGLEFVPMCWGITKGFPATWATNAQKMIDAGSKALFSFNEPDHAAQANLSPEQAAASHIELMNPFAGKARIGAPSITNSGASNQGIGWLKRWFEACDGKCAVDFVNIHIYGFDTNTFLQHLINVHNLFQKPVWITEFAFGGSDDEVDRQLREVIDQIEKNSTFGFVENYSYFMAADGMMVKGGSMSTYGNTFAYAS